MELTFAPLLPYFLVYAALAAVVVAAILGYATRMRATTLRAAAGLLLVAAIANPTVSREERSALSTVVPIIVDRSQSQRTGDREGQTDAALAALTDRLSEEPGIEPRVVDITTSNENGSAETRAFAALTEAVRDVPPSRLGAAFLITDGEIHDIPDDASGLPANVPVNALITGDPDEYDRRIEIDEAPRFGLVGESLPVEFTVINEGADMPASDQPVTVTARLNGSVVAEMRVEPGLPTRYVFDIPNGGENIIELSVPPVDGELTTVNNRAVQEIEGIRENLRVLLVSGSPHNGERTWRNLLKSDASVDLVHFTILRPPEKQDGTPINELSLIAFPTRELFVDKIKDFDLIIFDRYQNRGVLPLLYYDNIAQYVRNGGALLVAAGPEIASAESIADTPLSAVLPAIPTGDLAEGAFYPEISETGEKHPVTRDLPGGGQTPPAWGRWFRSIPVGSTNGETVMTADGAPLLVLSREGEGRVAEFLSDQGWLWARGFEGGGPYVPLYRRIAHWLMKEPALEEEALTARADGETLEITRQTMADAPTPATVLFPSGKSRSVTLQEVEPGLFRAEVPVDEMGLFTVENGDLRRLVNIGDPNAPEFRAMISTTETLAPLAEETDGVVARVAGGGLPQIRVIDEAQRRSGGAAMPIVATSDTRLESIRSLPLFNGLVGLAALLALISATWWREGRS
ncbi:membrane protein [Martelella endophytica]|uniref:Membrane protein n=1 Tax=Martelella endophytica TaxID=1486262 RepID=A0A0D5LPC2_MAREN|nr:membrane protein [Martelella endophytica]AJY45971.1 membrane protein [Martelella endophytica]